MFVCIEPALLRFKFVQLELGDRFYLPLPKLTPDQMKTIRRRLKLIGFKTSQLGVLKAAAGATRIIVNPRGLSSSNRDMTDVIAPVIPELLSAGRRTVSSRTLRNEYFVAARQDGALVVRLSPRLESSSPWEQLRAADSCALTPDEHAVYSALLSSSEVTTPLVTDFPTRHSRVRRIGRRQYYDSRPSPSEAASTLRQIGSRGVRNTYLPKSAVIRLTSVSPARDWASEVFRELGDWCFFSPPTPRKSSN